MMTEKTAWQEIAWNAMQIGEIASHFENKKLPDWAVGAIEGYCNNIKKIIADRKAGR